MTLLTNRYPGVRPFETHERHLFFGRQRDLDALYDLILLEKLIVLFGKSGYGKSSLLKAGIVPVFTDEEAPAERRYLPVQVRFGTYVAGKSIPPLEAVVNALDTFAVGADFQFLATLSPQARLWHHFKMRQSVSPETSARFLLIFDQFEEFFSYPAAEQAAFRTELAELLYEETPQDVRLAASRSAATTRPQRDFLADPFDAKAVFSIRADRLSLLDGLKDKLPAILHKRFELRALDERQAREAIVAPAGLSAGPSLRERGGAMAESTTDPAAPLPVGESLSHSFSGRSGEGFLSPPFTYAEDALQKMLRELSGASSPSEPSSEGLSAGVTPSFGGGAGGGAIEAFQLQIVCASIEKRVTERGLRIVSAADLPDFSTVYEDYYYDRIGELPESRRLPARRVLEDGLLLVDAQTGDARRLSRDAGELAQALDVAPALLLDLERTYLIRREANSLGGHNFEISHDTLLAPILKSRQTREAEAEALRQEQERAEAEHRAQEAEEKARAEQARAELAENLKIAAEDALSIAKEANARASQAVDLAQRENRKATRTAFIAIFIAILASIAGWYAWKQKKAADTALVQVSKLTLKEASTLIYHLNYEGALEKMKGAAMLKVSSEAVSDSLLEVVFFFAESNNTDRARGVLDTAARLVGRDLAGFGKLEAPDDFRQAIEVLAPGRIYNLQARYFPTMVSIPGGRDSLGDERRNLLQVSISPFKMAHTETTWWQFALFCAASNRTLPERPAGWGGEGNNPVVKVNWQDAVDYVNWLNQRQGLPPAITGQKGNQQINLRGGYRLPTEAEWEYAARAGTDFAYAGSNDADEVAWYYDNSQGRTHTIASKKSNAFGLYDLSGNVWEWCWDWYAEFHSGPLNNPTGPLYRSDNARVVRGGAWYLGHWYVRVSSHINVEPTLRNFNLGFRVAQGQ